MATGVKPRDEDIQMTRSDLDALQDAMKSKKFRDMLGEYFVEVRDPANQAIYQKEMTQLEKERGYDITFINPKGGYVIKTSVAGDRKAFINICSSDNVGKPSYNVKEVDGRKGMNWMIPYSLIPPREDYDNRRGKCVIYDVVFHPDTLRMAEVNKRFRELVNNTAIDALKSNYKIDLDCNNFRFPKSFYKGVSVPAVIRQEDPDFKPPSEEDTTEISPEVLDKLYPQHTYPKPNEQKNYSKATEGDTKVKHKNNNTSECRTDNVRVDNGYTTPKYIIKQQRNVDMQDYTFDKNCKEYSAIPSHLVISINLPLLSSTNDCTLDVQEKMLSLFSEKPARYKLNLTLPYSVDDQSGNAKFDKSKRTLTVTLPVIRKKVSSDFLSFQKADSGVDSEEYSGSQSDEDNIKEKLITELPLPETSIAVPAQPETDFSKADVFLEPTLGYILPPHTHNILDDVIAFTFHVKNTQPESVVVKQNDNKIQVKFTSIGSGFVPVHYAALIIFDESIKFEEVNGEAWDNNVIIQLELGSGVPQQYEIGLSEESLSCVQFDLSIFDKSSKEESTQNDEESLSIVEVTNSGNETSIVVSSNPNDFEDTEPESTKEKEIVWVEDNLNDSNAKSILRKNISRSLSESSAGDVASSMDYISSDCIPEESSFKKTVRFSDVIARQFYRYNSSIEGQKKKNQRKKIKKRTQDRRKSESEAEDDANIMKANKLNFKSVLKQRRDSGLADTSDAEMEFKAMSPVTSPSVNINDTPTKPVRDTCKDIAKEIDESNVVINNDNVKEYSGHYSRDANDVNEMLESQNTEPVDHKPITCDNIKHTSGLYDPDKLNKGEYVEVKFKNDLIFDLDM